MNQFFRSLPGHFATAWKSIIRHVSLTFSSATAVTVTLLIVGLLVIFLNGWKLLQHAGLM